jgi:uncharacterized protein (DUF1919 family)
MNQTNGQMDHDKQTPTSSLEITGKSLKSNKITDGENGAEVKEKCQRTMEKWLNRTLRIERKNLFYLLDLTKDKSFSGSK